MTKLVLIDPVEKTVTFADWPKDETHEKIRSFVGGWTDHFSFRAASGHPIVGWVYEYGLSDATPETRYFQVEGYHGVLAGKGVLMMCDTGEGDAIDWRPTLESTKAMVSFPQVKLQGFHDYEKRDGNWFVIGHTPIFEPREDE